MFEGILPIYKQRGITSHDVVFKARKILKMKKIGHAGTLEQLKLVITLWIWVKAIVRKYV